MSVTWTQETLLMQLSEWQKEGFLSYLDLAMARFVITEHEEPDIAAPVMLLTALLSYQVNRGHVCLSLADLLQQPEQTLQLEAALLARLTTSPACIIQAWRLPELIAAATRSHAIAARDSDPMTPAFSQPLVLDHGNLYFTRFWQYERAIATSLRARMQSRAFAHVSSAHLTHLLDGLFAHETQLDSAELSESQRINLTPWQKLACANTLRGRFSVITGGPGTGKTYTVVRLLALLQRLATEGEGSALQIKLAAPTGKAAARLKESIQQALNELTHDPMLREWAPTFAQIESDSMTLHKLLGTQQHTRHFRHNAHHPLSLDVLVVDEASMIDIEMMDALLKALPKHAQLILLGDKDQLASVEAGAVLGQLCEGAEQGHYRAETFDFLQSVSPTPLPAQLFDPHGAEHLQHVVMLRVSRRFDDASGIGQLARAVNRGDNQQLYELLRATQEASTYSDIELIHGAAPDKQAQLSAPDTQDAWQQPLWEELRSLCYRGFNQYWQIIQQHPEPQATALQIDEWATKVLDAYAGFQLLTALREGPFGVQGLNQQIASWLDYIPKQAQPSAADKRLAVKFGHWYEGRPVMVTENDYSLNLRNGDVGVTLYSPTDNALRVVFIDSQGQLRWILPSRLRHVQTVFAMTVHKSQGSEFKHAVLVLPPYDSPVLSRELIYTGITRAAQHLTLVVPRWQVLTQAVTRKTQRAGRILA